MARIQVNKMDVLTPKQTLERLGAELITVEEAYQTLVDCFQANFQCLNVPITRVNAEALAAMFLIELNVDWYGLSPELSGVAAVDTSEQQANSTIRNAVSERTEIVSQNANSDELQDQEAIQDVIQEVIQHGIWSLVRAPIFVRRHEAALRGASALMQYGAEQGYWTREAGFFDQHHHRW